MAVWAISDLHLGRDMSQFGDVWIDHPQTIADEWTARVGDEDVVLIPGDLSWGQRREQIVEDLRWLDALPGIKVLSPGNHDYGIWKSRNQARRALADLPSLKPIRNEALRLELADGTSLAVCAWKGADPAGHPSYDPRAWEKEQRRMGLALTALAEVAQPGDRRVALVHYPPFGFEAPLNPAILGALTTAAVDVCLYGHVHDQLTAGQVACAHVDGIRFWSPATICG